MSKQPAEGAEEPAARPLRLARFPQPLIQREPLACREVARLQRRHFRRRHPHFLRQIRPALRADTQFPHHDLRATLWTPQGHAA